MEYHSHTAELAYARIRIINGDADPVKLSQQLAARRLLGLKLIQRWNNLYRCLGRSYYSIPREIREDYASDLVRQCFSESVDHIPQLAIDLLQSTTRFDNIRANVFKIEPVLMAVEMFEHECEFRAIMDRVRNLFDDQADLKKAYEQNGSRYSDTRINYRTTLFAAWARHLWEVQRAIRLGFLQDDDEDIFDFMSDNEDQLLDAEDEEYDESREAEQQIRLEVDFIEDGEYDERADPKDIDELREIEQKAVLETERMEDSE